jgi:hypothetical protein
MQPFGFGACARVVVQHEMRLGRCANNLSFSRKRLHAMQRSLIVPDPILHKTCAEPSRPAMSGRAGEQTVFWGGEGRQGWRARRFKHRVQSLDPDGRLVRCSATNTLRTQCAVSSTTGNAVLKEKRCALAVQGRVFAT